MTETPDADLLAERFEAHRPRLRAVAHRVPGSFAEADDAVQEGWFRLSRSSARDIDNLGGRLTTVVGRVCLDMLRARTSRREQPLESGRESVPVAGPEQDALLADSGVALLVVLEALTPAERLAFVLHDLFAVPYEEIAAIVDRTPAVARQLAGRARRRVRGAPAPDGDPRREREVVEAFLAAARDGDSDGPLRVLDPEVARSETGVSAGAVTVARGAASFARLARLTETVLVGGRPGVVVRDSGGRPARAPAFTVVRDRIAVIEFFTEPGLIDETPPRGPARRPSVRRSSPRSYGTRGPGRTPRGRPGRGAR
ncbi:putative ECF RNA polymerase sigma factor SigI [Streptomyces sp. enrichment culture]|uniref:sigma-70 family RNA polymerase sigma factor n=1 Tax=Streptomyces sp. enrichment culture TaxID=1795815 RepID=UPI003F576287